MMLSSSKDLWWNYLCFMTVLAESDHSGGPANQWPCRYWCNCVWLLQYTWYSEFILGQFQAYIYIVLSKLSMFFSERVIYLTRSYLLVFFLLFYVHYIYTSFIYHIHLFNRAIFDWIFLLFVILLHCVLLKSCMNFFIFMVNICFWSRCSSSLVGASYLSFRLCSERLWNIWYEYIRHISCDLNIFFFTWKYHQCSERNKF